MKLKHYILVGHDAIEVPLLEWAQWMEEDPAGRIVERETYDDGKIIVSTIFLGLDYSFMYDDDDTPILFETMVFGGALDHEQERYATYDQAISGHHLIALRVIEVLELERMSK